MTNAPTVDRDEPKAIPWIVYRRAREIVPVADNLLRRPWVQVVLLLILCAPILFLNALRYSLPVGYAGLYSLMAEQVSTTGAGLPSSVPFYGLGGTYFAYPPLGILLMAAIERLTGVSPLAYARFAPPVLALLSLIPLYWLAREVTHSSAAGFIAGVIVATSPRNYLFHVEAAGLVRALALAVALLAAYVFLRTLRAPSWRGWALASLLLALTGLTHLVYALFLLVGLPCLTLAVRTRKSVGLALGIVTCGVVLAAPWAWWVAANHGWSALVAAAQSHGNADTFQLLHNPLRILTSRTEDALRNLLRDTKLASLVVTGMVFSLASLHLEIPLWFAGTIMFIPEGDRFITILGAIVSGSLLAVLLRSLRRSSDDSPPGPGQMGRSWLFLAAMVVLFYRSGLQAISAYRPAISPATIQLAVIVRSSTPPEATFVAVTPSEEAEWLPFLLHREIAISPWGAEWRGDYAEQSARASQAVECASEDTFTCLDSLLAALGSTPDLLITHRLQSGINDGLRSSGSWAEIYSNADYILWAHVPSQ